MCAPPDSCRRGFRRAAFTLAEVVISLALAGICMGALVSGYINSARRAEFAAFSAAAQSAAQARLDQAVAARWDTLAVPPVDELVPANFAQQTVRLGVPEVGTNASPATVRTSIELLSVSGRPLKRIRAECEWQFLGRWFTNRLVVYRSPDQ